MLTQSVEFLALMVCNAVIEDHSGAAKYGEPSIGRIFTIIFEGHALLQKFMNVNHSHPSFLKNL